MPENRFFAPQKFIPKETISLSGEELHHLHVMRRHRGDRIELVNGQNQLAKASIQKLGKTSAELHIDDVIEKPPPSHQLILAQALLKPKNLDLVIEKGTELGASAFWLFPSQKTEKKNYHLQRLQKLTISALKQCGRLDLPPILEKPPLLEWNKPEGALFFGDLHSKAPFHPPKGIDLMVFIGPEKGFSEEEQEILRNRFQAKGVSFHPNILRAETAVLCALSQAFIE